MALTLTTDERTELERRVRSLKIRSEDARRARVILMLANGDSYSTIEATVPCFRDYINRWRRRFVADRVDGEIANRKGVASGAVRVEAARGDVARTDRIYYDGDFLRSDTRVDAAGPGYRVEGNGLLARTDGSVIQLTDGVKGKLQTEARP